MPAYNEEKAVAVVVEEFRNSPYVDEVIVVDNNSTDRTKEKAEKAGARVVKEEEQGYGYACQRALREGTGDYLVLAESDSTFRSEDLPRFLAYAQDFDLVQGTRTDKEHIFPGANMGNFLRWGNWWVAKMLQVLYRGPALTDMGCTYRLIGKEARDRIKDHLTVGGSAFLADMTTVALKQRLKVKEIPISYGRREGQSKITGSFRKSVLVGLNMLRIILLNLFKEY